MSKHKNLYLSLHKRLQKTKDRSILVALFNILFTHKDMIMNKSATFLVLSMLFISTAHAANEGWGSWLYNGATSGATQFGTHFVGGFPAGCASVLATRAIAGTHSYAPLSNENKTLASQFLNHTITIGLALKTESLAGSVERTAGIQSKSNKTRWERLAGLAGTSAGWLLGQSITNGTLKKIQS